MAVAAVNLMTDTIRVYDVRTLRLRLQPRHFRMFIHDSVQQALPSFPSEYQLSATPNVAMRVFYLLVP